MGGIRGIKAISFDADGTLWDFSKVMHHSLGYVMKELEKADPLAASRLNIEKLIEIRNRVAEELKGKITNLEEVRLEAFRQTLAEVARPDDALAERLNKTYLEHRFEDIELFPDVLPALRSLKSNYTLGLLSNGNSYPERCGLDGIFGFVVFSQEHGVEKPDPRIFQITLQRAGCAAEELLHVGDSLENDVEGASSVGIRSVWLNREGCEREGCEREGCEGRTNDQSIDVECEIESLSELVELLR